MDAMELMRARHSVRSYNPKKIEAEKVAELTDFIHRCNAESGLHIQLVLDEPEAFDSTMAHYGKFSGVRNYIAMVGKKGSELGESVGYYGEKIVLKAQEMGLNTCWVALTYSKNKSVVKINSGEKLVLVISLGYGNTQGVPHKSKKLEEVTNLSDTAPQWFLKGMEGALLAPTAMNQQKFTFSLDGDKVSAKAGLGFYTKLDLGIVKYHFELAAGGDVPQKG